MGDESRDIDLLQIAVLRADAAGRVVAADRAARDFFRRNDRGVPTRLPEGDELSALLPPRAEPGVRVFERQLPGGQREILLLPSRGPTPGRSGESEAVGSLAGGIAHQLNNLLTVIAQATELIPGSKEPHELVEVCNEAISRASELTQQLLVIAHKYPHAPEPLVLDALVADVVASFADRLGPMDVELSLEAGPTKVYVDPEQFRRALGQLVCNGVDAAGQRIRIETRLRPARDGGWGRVRIRLSDDGCGMDAATLRRAYDPFFTTKGRAVASGLGLSTALAIVERHGGTLSGASVPGSGTTMDIDLPIEMGDPAGLAPSALAGGPEATVAARIFLVEDEELVRSVARRSLEAAGFAVETAASAEDAVVQLSHIGDLDLLVADVVLPGLSGTDLALSVCRERPGLRVLFVSGYADGVEVEAMRQRLGASFLSKPYSASALVERVRECLAGTDTRPADR